MTKSELARLAATKGAYGAVKTKEMKARAMDFQSGGSEKDSASVSQETASSSRQRGVPRRQRVGSAALNNAKKKVVRSAKREAGRDLTKKGYWPIGLPFEPTWSPETLSCTTQDARECPFWDAIGDVAARVLTEEGALPGPLKMRVATTRWELYKKTGQRRRGDSSVPEITRELAMSIGELKMKSVPRDPKYVGTQPPARWSDPDEDSDDANEEGGQRVLPPYSKSGSTGDTMHGNF